MMWLIPEAGGRAHALDAPTISQLIIGWQPSRCGIDLCRAGLRQTKQGDHACKLCLRVLKLREMTPPQVDGAIRGGESRSAPKVAASRINGTKGGRPKKAS